MAVFSENQVRLLYVANSFKSTPVEETDAVGTLSVQANADNDVYFKQKGVDTVLRSDLIKKSRIISAKATPASALRTPMKKFNISLDPAINGGNPVAGQEYILRFVFFEWGSLSPEDQYYKYGIVKAVSGMTPTQFMEVMYNSLVANFSREQLPLLKFTNLGTSIEVEEVPQPWELGLKEGMPLNFKIYTPDILVNGDELPWGIVTEEAPTTFVEDGHKVADLEYFLHGELGDQYRNVGWPYTWNTKYLVNPDNLYNLIDIAFYFEDQGMSNQHSDKAITIAVPAPGNDNTLTNEIIAAINTAAGTTIPTL